MRRAANREVKSLRFYPASCRRQRRPPDLVVFSQPRVGQHDRFEFGGDDIEVGSGNDGVELIVGNAGVDAIANAAEARRDAARESRGYRHACWPTQQWQGALRRSYRGFVQQHQFRGLARDDDSIRRNWCLRERRINRPSRRVREPCNAGDFVQLDVADVHHQSERAGQVGLTLGRQRNVVRVAADGTVEVIRGYCVKDLATCRKTPETAPRWLRTRKREYSFRRSVAESDGNWTAGQTEYIGQPPLHLRVVSHKGTLSNSQLPTPNSSGIA